MEPVYVAKSPHEKALQRALIQYRDPKNRDLVEEALRRGALERVLPGWHALSLGLWMTMPSRKHVPARTRAFWNFMLRTFGDADRDPWQTHPLCSGAPTPV